MLVAYTESLVNTSKKELIKHKTKDLIATVTGREEISDFVFPLLSIICKTLDLSLTYTRPDLEWIMKQERSAHKHGLRQ